MRLKLYLVVVLVLLTGCNGASKQEKEIDNARLKVIELNQKYNKLYQAIMSQYMAGNSDYEAAGMCLQMLTKEIIAVNKALKIDCKQYDENGEAIMVEGKNGLSPIEIIPNELKIEK